MYKKIILMILVIGFLFCGPANAQIINGDFEGANTSGWTLGGTGTTSVSYPNFGGIYGSHSLRLYTAQPGSTNTYMRQEFNPEGYDFLEWDAYYYGGATGHFWVNVYYNSTNIFSYNYYTGGGAYWKHDTINLTDYQDYNMTIKFSSYKYAAFDNVNLTGYTPPEDESFIYFSPNINITDIKPVLCEYSIDPDSLNYYYDNDTKRVGNTVEIINWWTSNTSPELPSLWISEGFTASNVSGNHTLEYCNSYDSIYDIELRASWYELDNDVWLWHHGIDGILLASDTILWDLNYTFPDPDPEPDPDPYDPPDPYVPPEIPPPPMPNDWNMTIPDKYQNVTWLVNYTTYFSEVGGTVNTTLYSVSGWVISPLMTINNTVYSLRYYMASTHNMVNGLAHLHMIVNYGWAVIPIEIKTIFTGTAAIGVCIFLFKRRT